MKLRIKNLPAKLSKPKLEIRPSSPKQLYQTKDDSIPIQINKIDKLSKTPLANDYSDSKDHFIPPQSPQTGYIALEKKISIQ